MTKVFDSRNDTGHTAKPRDLQDFPSLRYPYGVIWFGFIAHRDYSPLKIAGMNTDTVKTSTELQAVDARSDNMLRTTQAAIVSLFNRLLHWKGGRVGKKLVLLGLLPSGIALGYLFYLSIVAGFVVSHLGGGAASGKPGRVKSLILPLRQYELHFHHWFLASIAAVSAAIHGFSIGNPSMFYGFLSGLTLQGIYCYTDWYRILKRKVLVPVYESVHITNY